MDGPGALKRQRPRNPGAALLTVAKPPLIYIKAKQHAPQLLPTLEQYFTCHQVPPLADAWVDVVKPVAKGVRALVTGTMVGADAALLDALPDLEVVIVAGGHVDLVDPDTVARRGIRITNTPNASAPDVADLAMALMLDATRRVSEADRWVRRGEWKEVGAPLFSRRLNGKRLGIVGLGAIGGRVASRAQAFDMDVAYTGRAAKPGVPYRYVENILQLATEVDVLSLHCSVTPATRKMIDSRVLAALGPAGILVNVARGPVVDQPALIAALRAGTIAAAGLDVFDDEPNVAADLMTLENVVLNPHHGAFTFEAKKTMVDLALANLQAFFEGRPLATPIEPHAH